MTKGFAGSSEYATEAEHQRQDSTENDRLRAVISQMVENTKRTDCTSHTLLIGCRMIGEKALKAQ